MSDQNEWSKPGETPEQREQHARDPFATSGQGSASQGATDPDGDPAGQAPDGRSAGYPGPQQDGRTSAPGSSSTGSHADGAHTGGQHGQQAGGQYGQQTGAGYGQQAGGQYGQQAGGQYGQYGQQAGGQYGQQAGGQYGQQAGGQYGQQDQYGRQSGQQHGQQPPSSAPYGGGQQQDPYARNPYAQTPYAQNPSGQANPYAQNPYGQANPHAQTGYQPYGQRGKTSLLAILSLVFALGGIVIWPLVILTSPAGAVMGHVALGRMKHSGEQGRGLAIAGIACGWALTALYVIGLVLFIAFIASHSYSDYGSDSSGYGGSGA